jgi:hypothetical protein
MKTHPNRAKHFPKNTPQPPFYRACLKSHGLPPPRLLVNPQGQSAVRFRHVQTRPLNFPKYWQIQIPWPDLTILRAPPQVAVAPLLHRHFQNRPVTLILFQVVQGQHYSCLHTFGPSLVIKFDPRIICHRTLPELSKNICMKKNIILGCICYDKTESFAWVEPLHNPAQPAFCFLYHVTIAWCHPLTIVKQHYTRGMQ